MAFTSLQSSGVLFSKEASSVELWMSLGKLDMLATKVFYSSQSGLRHSFFLRPQKFAGLISFIVWRRLDYGVRLHLLLCKRISKATIQEILKKHKKNMLFKSLFWIMKTILILCNNIRSGSHPVSFLFRLAAGRFSFNVEVHGSQRRAGPFTPRNPRTRGRDERRPARTADELTRRISTWWVQR